MPFNQQRMVRSPTGADLNLFVRQADGQPRAVVQINHGLAEHAARYARFADFLAARGFHVYVHDHRGHGATRAPDAPLGKFADEDGPAKVIADVDAIHDLIAGEQPNLPVILFGHSMGASVALNYLSGAIRHASMPPRSGTAISHKACLGRWRSASSPGSACGWAPMSRRACCRNSPSRPGARRCPTTARCSTGCRATRPRWRNTLPIRCAAGMPLSRCGATWSRWRSMAARMPALPASGATFPSPSSAVRKTPPRTMARASPISPIACAGWAFRISFQRFTPTPATKA